MSGQPNRKANSAEKFKNAYMDALNLRANVDDFNLQANKNFKKTGTLPPNVQQMVDNRTTTEILADTEKLKLKIIGEFKPVMTPNTASIVVQRLQTAPANADGSFLIWVAQNITEIVKSLKKKYAIGIKGDVKDAENIVIFLSDMYSKIKDYSGTVKTYFDTVGDSKTGLKEGDLDALRKEYEVIVARLKIKFPNYRQPSERAINDLIIRTTEKIQRLYSLLTNSRYRELISRMQGVRGRVQLSQVNGVNDVSKAVFELLDQLPAVPLVRALYAQLDRSLENKDAIGADKTHTTLSVKILQAIYDLFPSIDEVNRIYGLFTHDGPDDPPDDYDNDKKPDKGIFTNYPPDENEDPEHNWMGDFGELERFMNEELTQIENIPDQLQMYNELLRVKNELMDRLVVLRDNIEDAYNRTEKRVDFYANKRDAVLKSRRYTIPEQELFKDRLDKALKDYAKQSNDLDNVEVWIEDTRRDIKQIESNINKLKQPISRPEDIIPLKPKKQKHVDEERQMIDDSGPYPLAINRRAGNPAEGFLGPPKSGTKKKKDKHPTSDIPPDEPVPSLTSLGSPSTSLALPSPSPTTIEGLKNKLDNKKKDKLILEQWYNDPTANRSQTAQQKIKDEIDKIEDEIGDINDEILDMRASGTGLKKRRGRPRGSGISFKDNIDHAKGIQPVKKYHPFGKYFVNSHKLNNGNVLSIKSKSGTNIREYPSRTVSPHLGHVIKTIIGGGVPSYNDMEKLTNDEKDYLYKISKRAEFVDKISIPTPSKDQQEKDIHEFEVCKGEIMAGNDSKELIKKFKLLIIKLSKNGTIPKREASEVMTELLELGY
jgi:hypothetical protein